MPGTGIGLPNVMNQKDRFEGTQSSGEIPSRLEIDVQKLNQKAFILEIKNVYFSI